MSIWFPSYTRNVARARGPPRIARLSRISVGHGRRDGKGVSQGSLPIYAKYSASAAPFAIPSTKSASQNDLLMQFQSDILGRPVLRSASPDASALGAAYLAGLAVSVWSSQEEISRLPGPRARFNPRMTEAERERLYAGWQKALTQTMLGTEEYMLHTRNKV